MHRTQQVRLYFLQVYLKRFQWSLSQAIRIHLKVGKQKFTKNHRVTVKKFLVKKQEQEKEKGKTVDQSPKYWFKNNFIEKRKVKV